MNTFTKIVGEIKELSTEEIKDLYFITKRYLIKSQREKIYQNHIDSLSEFEKGLLTFSDNIEDLKKMLDKDD
ncbi:MAG: hypothetical protein FVQ77_01280 [Cytophagales bacterium]|nr:hypothetical protein [Cytophagales bacterium]